jgi:hypothetical protein
MQAVIAGRKPGTSRTKCRIRHGSRCCTGASFLVQSTMDATWNEC